MKKTIYTKHLVNSAHFWGHAHFWGQILNIEFSGAGNRGGPDFLLALWNMVPTKGKFGKIRGQYVELPRDTTSSMITRHLRNVAPSSDLTPRGSEACLSLEARYRPADHHRLHRGSWILPFSPSRPHRRFLERGRQGVAGLLGAEGRLRKNGAGLDVWGDLLEVCWQTIAIDYHHTQPLLQHDSKFKIWPWQPSGNRSL